MVVKDFRLSTLIVVLVGLAAVSCGGLLDANSSSWLRATIVEEESSSLFEGSGDFQVGPDPAAGADIQFLLVSEGTGSSTGAGSIMLVRPGAGIPSVGEHSLSLLSSSSDGQEGFTAYFFRQVDGAVNESFTTVAGKVRITTASQEKVEGSFEFTAVLYCSTPLVDSILNPGPCDPQAPIDGGKQVIVEGSFSATPFVPGAPIRD